MLRNRGFPEAWSRLCVCQASFLMTFAMGGAPHAGSQQCWERLKAGGEGDDRGWDGWMASPSWWTWVWASSGSWGEAWCAAVHRVAKSQHDWATELNWCMYPSLYLPTYDIYLCLSTYRIYFSIYLPAYHIYLWILPTYLRQSIHLCIFLPTYLRHLSMCLSFSLLTYLSCPCIYVPMDGWIGYMETEREDR